MTAVAKGDRKPNVILILADDLGYQDLGCYDHPSIRTPVLDQLAKDGIRLTNFHSGASVCTPSRMALLTGAYPVRLGWTQGVAGYLMGSKDGMSPEVLTIAEIFRAEGYTTGIAGKWHIGQLPEIRPHHQGFDSTCYCPMSNNQLKEIWHDDEIVVKPVDNRLFTEYFNNQALRFIRENHEKPFFLYLPFTAPHFPVEAHPDWKGKSKFGEYGDVVEELDARIGEILKWLEDLKLSEDTLVIFTTDNGAETPPLHSSSTAFCSSSCSTFAVDEESLRPIARTVIAMVSCQSTGRAESTPTAFDSWIKAISNSSDLVTAIKRRTAESRLKSNVRESLRGWILCYFRWDCP